MIFNSIEFLTFFTAFFLLYWTVFKTSLKAQNIFLLGGGYLFYAWWDWRFLLLLVAGSLINYVLGIELSKTESPGKRKWLMFLALLQGLGTLIFFKYFNFFIVSLAEAFAAINIDLHVRTLSIILPLGISFYTFRTLSYVFDINRGKIKPTYDWSVFFAYVSFFPSVISGPIDRANTFIPQLETKRSFNYHQGVDGLRQILWGLFKKMVVADGCAELADQIFNNYQAFSGSTLAIGAFFFTVQVYADFSGYSDMAIGIARLLGFNISKNFDYPYFAQNIAEFWRKWHISLTRWLTDYVFTPLTITFRDYGKTGLIIAITLNMIACGLWHGANWTFVVFGLVHGLYFIPLILRGTLNKKKKISKDRKLPSLIEIKNIVATFSLIVLTNILFRSSSISQAFDYYKGIFSRSLFSSPEMPFHKLDFLNTLGFIFLMFLTEWLQRNKEYGLQIDSIKRRPIRLGIYYAIVFVIILFGGSEQAFIYIQF